MAHGKSVSKAGRLRALAESVEQIATAAVLADETLAKARQDILQLAAAARRVATRLEREADAAEVNCDR